MCADLFARANAFARQQAGEVTVRVLFALLRRIVDSMTEKIEQQAYDALSELADKAGIAPGSLIVVGCSSSEVRGETVGTASSPEIGQAVFRGVWKACQERGLDLAAQCCEHLNRALVVRRGVALERGYEQVNAVPIPTAGGSFGAAAYADMPDAIVVEHIQAEAGIDIGSTLIGMHLRAVVSPVRLRANRVGQASVIAARTRPKYVGGARAVYDDALAHVPGSKGAAR